MSDRALETVLMAVLKGSWMVAALVGAAFFAYLFKSARRAANLVQHGEPAEATVLKIERTLMQINRNHVFKLLLEVRRPGHVPYQVTLESRIHTWNVSVMDVGLRLDIKVDPKDPQRIHVVGPVIPQASLAGVLAKALQSGGLPAGDPVKAMAALQEMADEGTITPEEHARKKAEILSRL